jgi:hypothetical protein
VLPRAVIHRTQAPRRSILRASAPRAPPPAPPPGCSLKLESAHQHQPPRDQELHHIDGFGDELVTLGVVVGDIMLAPRLHEQLESVNITYYQLLSAIIRYYHLLSAITSTSSSRPSIVIRYYHILPATTSMSSSRPSIEFWRGSLSSLTTRRTSCPACLSPIAAKFRLLLRGGHTRPVRARVCSMLVPIDMELNVALNYNKYAEREPNYYKYEL